MLVADIKQHNPKTIHHIDCPYAVNKLMIVMQITASARDTCPDDRKPQTTAKQTASSVPFIIGIKNNLQSPD